MFLFHRGYNKGKIVALLFPVLPNERGERSYTQEISSIDI